jgi:hypothetical protein
MYIIDLRRRLQDKRCKENGNIRTHFDTMCTSSLHEHLVAIRDSLNDKDFSVMLLGPLPQSCPDTLMLSIIDEFLNPVRRTIKARMPHSMLEVGPRSHGRVGKE